MVDRVSWVPEGVNVDVPSSARIYDYLLGGGHNFEADRATAEALIKVLPVRGMARLNRAYLRRAVLELADLGIRQFLDLGSGIPTVGNVHEVAHEVAPDSKVVYVDFEPVAITHAELMLADEPNVTALLADLREPEKVIAQARELLDFSQPIGLLVVGVLQFIPDSDDPWGVLARYVDALPAGSYLALSHFTADSMPPSIQSLHTQNDQRRPRAPKNTLAVMMRRSSSFSSGPTGSVSMAQLNTEVSMPELDSTTPGYSRTSPNPEACA